MQKQIMIRKATKEDVTEIVHLLADDMLGSKRENSGSDIAQSYYDAFDAINNDANQLLIMAEIEGKVVGTLQISYVTNMSHKGAKRAMIEGVHVDVSLRSQGIGQYMMEWAIAEAVKQGCRFVQLTSNKQRKEAHRFYERLGFVATHEGFKLDLDNT
jgi:predicted N-acetyltransferase YhbS